jgi:hypothetical protein
MLGNCPKFICVGRAKCLASKLPPQSEKRFLCMSLHETSAADRHQSIMDIGG